MHSNVRVNKSKVLDYGIACGKSGSEASFLGNNTEVWALQGRRPSPADVFDRAFAMDSIANYG